MILESCISCESCKDWFEGLPGSNRGKMYAFKPIRKFGVIIDQYSVFITITISRYDAYGPAPNFNDRSR